MRINFSVDEERPGQFALWDANVQRSIKGRAGQAALRELEAALVAMPVKRLLYGVLCMDDGEVCAIGAYARHKGLDLSRFDPEAETDAVGVEAGMPRLIAWEVVMENDRDRWRVSHEQRYDQMLAWVRAQLKESV